MDAEIPLSYLDPKLQEVVDRFEPFGEGNPPLSFLTRGLRVAHCELIGRREACHLKLLFEAGKVKWPAVYWNAAQRFPGEFGDRGLRGRRLQAGQEHVGRGREPAAHRPRPEKIMIPVLILLLLAGPACGETILLSRPRAAVCVASPDAEYVLEQGELKPVRGFFAFSPPGEPPLQPAITTPGQAFPGDMVRVRVRSAEPLDSLVVLLTDMKSRQVSRTSVFRLDDGDG